MRSRLWELWEPGTGRPPNIHIAVAGVMAVLFRLCPSLVRQQARVVIPLMPWVGVNTPEDILYSNHVCFSMELGNIAATQLISQYNPYTAASMHPACREPVVDEVRDYQS